jgi:Na+/H+-dicarboxylate symporter
MFHLIQKKFYLLMFISLAISLLAAYGLPEPALISWYSLSLQIKELIVIMMPVLIFCCGFQCMAGLKGKGLLLLVLIISMIMLSNFISSLLGYFASTQINQSTLNHLVAPTPVKTLAAHSIWQLPRLLSNEVALASGLLLGLLSPIFFPKKMENALKLSHSLSATLLNKLLLPIIPLFISGFIIKMAYEGTVQLIFQQYAYLALLLLGLYSSYLLLGYALVAKFKVRQWLSYLKHVLPAGWVGFTSMSSLAALPLNLKACENNTTQPKIAKGVLPISTNIHLIGDSIGIPVMAMIILYLYTASMPTLAEYLPFAMLLVLAKFSVAAVPGGGILVMLPILQTHLGFNGEMAALITMLYVLLDPIITAVNIMGNGLLVIVLDKLLGLINFKMPINAFQE